MNAADGHIRTSTARPGPARLGGPQLAIDEGKERLVFLQLLVRLLFSRHDDMNEELRARSSQRHRKGNQTGLFRSKTGSTPKVKTPSMLAHGFDRSHVTQLVASQAHLLGASLVPRTDARTVRSSWTPREDTVHCGPAASRTYSPPRTRRSHCSRIHDAVVLWL